MTVNITKELALDLEVICARFELFDKAATLRAALDVPAAVDCRWCKRFAFCSANTYNDQRFENCTDFDKYTPLHEATALPPVVLTKVTK